MIVIAKNPDKEDLTPTVKDLVTEETKKTLEEVPDTAEIHWVDVKKAYPEIADKLKDLFKGKKLITVKDLKETLVEEQDELFWLSEDEYDYRFGQSQLDDLYGKNQEVLQYNIDNKLVNEINKDALYTDFFTDFSRLMESSPHPVHTQTLGWIRYYKFPDFWVIEEIQSDLFGEDTRLKNLANSDVKKMVDGYDDEEKKKIEDFFADNFKDWDKKLVSSLLNMARREGIKDIWIFDEDIKRDTQVSPSKRKHFYKKLPRDMGFKRDQLKVGDKDLKAWHRAVAKLAVASILDI